MSEEPKPQDIEEILYKTISQFAENFNNASDDRQKMHTDVACQEFLRDAVAEEFAQPYYKRYLEETQRRRRTD